MESFFADTSFFYSLIDKNEGDYHRRASAWLSETIGRVHLISSNYIFDELVTLILIRLDKATCMAACEKLRQSPTIHWHFIDQSEEAESWNLFTHYRDKAWSFTDCTSHVLMKSLKLTSILTWDHHFAQMGFSMVL